jgi:hypothetical protein
VLPLDDGNAALSALAGGRRPSSDPSIVFVSLFPSKNSQFLKGNDFAASL